MSVGRRIRGSRPVSPDELLLSASLGLEAPDRWEAWLDAVSLDDAGPASASLLPHVYRHLAEAAYEGKEMGRLRGICRQGWYRSQLLLEQTGRLFERLSSTDVAATAFGDLAVDRWSRADQPSYSLQGAQILVPTDSVFQVLDVARSLQWSLVNDNYPNVLRQRLKGLHFPGGLNLTVHWYFVDRHEYSGNGDPLWPKTIGGWDAAPTISTLSATDQLLSTMADGAEPGGVRLRWIPDAVDVIRTGQASIDWDRLVEAATGLGLRLVVRDRLKRLTHFIPDLVPRSVVPSLGAAVGREGIEHWFVRHSGTGYPWRSIPSAWSRYRYQEKLAGRRARFAAFSAHVLQQRRATPKAPLKRSAGPMGHGEDQ